MKLAVYIHIALLSRWDERIRAYISLMEKGGLMDTLDHIHLSFVGEGDIDETIWSAYRNKISIHRASLNLSDYEVPTQKLLYDFCCKHIDYKVLYIHTKNVGKPINPCVEDWVDYMSHFCITRWNDCVKQLESFQTVGVDLRDNPTLHYSGNFWWARASYIAMLPDPNEYKNIELYPNPLNSPRHNQEFWICFYKYPDFHKGLWESNINCYERHLHRYSTDKYMYL